MKIIAIAPLKNRAIQHFKMLIDGQWCDASDGATIERMSPAHDQVVSIYPAATIDDTQRAIDAAVNSFEHGHWRQMSGNERADILLKIADKIAERAEDFAQLDAIEAGKPIAQVRGEIKAAVDIWRYAASLCRILHGEAYNSLGRSHLGMVLREPIGVVTIITPWNFPFLIVSQKLPFALAAGCSVVIKPSELTSGSTLLLGQILLEAGIDHGVVNIISGYGNQIGPTLTSHSCVAMVSFTGSTNVGKSSMANAAQTLKKVSLELGGKNPQIIFPDADLDAVIDAAVFGGFFNAGECCNAGSRLIVHDDIADQVVAKISQHCVLMPIGDPLHDDTKMGALITPAHQAKVLAAIAGAQNEGAKLVCGGKALDLGQGQFIAPTIFDHVTSNMAIAREEVFGPVLVILRFKTLQQAITIANDVDYGLSASIWSRNIDTCLALSRQLAVGTVWINSFMDGAAQLPFGGYKQSGLGRELGLHSVEDYCETKTVNMHIGERSRWLAPG